MVPSTPRDRTGNPGDADDYDGTPEPDLRGPDGEPGTKDDWIVYFWGTEEGSAGCFTNDEVNCAGATGSKSAKWSLEQVFDFGNCVVRSTLTNTTDEPDPRCPNPGCIFSWSSPGLPNLEKNVLAAIAEKPIGPGESVGAIQDGPGITPCSLLSVNYDMQWNPGLPSSQPANNLAAIADVVLVDGNSLKLFDGIVESLVGPGGGFVKVLVEDLQMPIVDVGCNPANGHLDVLGLNCLKGFDESGNPLGIVGETLQEPALYRAVT